MKTRSFLAVALAVAALVAASGIAFLTTRGASKPGLPCQVVADGRTYRLDREQVANAGVITTAAGAMGLPHHAVTIAIAASLQESQLHNLTYGDRDSLGLFQQRPSQGWGSPSQILTPRFAAESFFRALASTDGWSAMSVSDAAQSVQRSASPTAYAAWENEARSLARATTGELPGALSCSA
jgi:hypothetical protein